MSFRNDNAQQYHYVGSNEFEKYITNFRPCSKQVKILDADKKVVPFNLDNTLDVSNICNDDESDKCDIEYCYIYGRTSDRQWIDEKDECATMNINDPCFTYSRGGQFVSVMIDNRKQSCETDLDSDVNV